VVEERAYAELLQGKFGELLGHEGGHAHFVSFGTELLERLRGPREPFHHAEALLGENGYVESHSVHEPLVGDSDDPPHVLGERPHQAGPQHLLGDVRPAERLPGPPVAVEDPFGRVGQRPVQIEY
jgi:hypothetical protein